jgi:HipA-like C-terminal domain
LLATSTAGLLDRRAFVKAQLAFWMLCATDGHAKNFSIFHRPQGAFQLTPLYDVLSAWPVIGHGQPYAFTEHGAIQAANVLSSPRAIAMGVYVVRAFVLPIPGRLPARNARGTGRATAG